MSWVFTPPPAIGLTVVGSQARFPLQRVFCVGRNYAEHAQEMGHSGREDPFFFCKSAQVVVAADESAAVQIPYPAQTVDLHHEVELVVALGQGGVNLSTEQAFAAIYGYAIGLDMTRRDLQAKLKEQGRSWEISKAFDASAVIGPVYPISQTGALDTGAIHLTVNDELRQQGDFSQLIWSVAESIAYLSHYFTLLPGDVLMTGTPAGVGAVQVGDVMIATIEGLGQLEVTVN